MTEYSNSNQALAPHADADDPEYRNDYKTSDPNWYEGLNPNLRIREGEVTIDFVQVEKGIRRPEYQTAGSAGMDICSSQSVTIPPGQWTMVSTGLMLAIPEGFVGMVCPRSGLAFKHGITVLNGPGIVDSDFRGELKVILINHSESAFQVQSGDRIAQLVISPLMRARLNPVSSLSETARGDGGFGSTGKR